MGKSSSKVPICCDRSHIVIALLFCIISSLVQQESRYLGTKSHPIARLASFTHSSADAMAKPNVTVSRSLVLPVCILER